MPAATFTPMLPEAPENALPDNAAVLVASTFTQRVVDTVPLRLAYRSATPSSMNRLVPLSSVSKAIPPTPSRFGLGVAFWIALSMSMWPVLLPPGCGSSPLQLSR
ncbi:hypothetical protein D3C72_2001530 [compost metagenome]